MAIGAGCVRITWIAGPIGTIGTSAFANAVGVAGTPEWTGLVVVALRLGTDRVG